MKKLLAIFAHPDDESFGPSSGTLAKYAQEGVSVHYLCATRGEAGTVNAHLLTDHHSIAALRTAELKRAVNALGLTGLHFLEYRDSGMWGAPDNDHENSLLSAPLDDVAQAVLAHIMQLQPDAIITHDRYGWYGHPDHIKCYQAVLRAYELGYGFNLETIQARSLLPYDVPRLYASTFPKWPVKLTVRALPLVGRDPRRYGQNGDIDLTQIASWQLPVTTRIHVQQYLYLKDRAVACHASQIPLTKTRNAPFRLLLRRMEQVETYQRLYPPVFNAEPSENNLFGSGAEMRSATRAKKWQAKQQIRSWL